MNEKIKLRADGLVEVFKDSLKGSGSALEYALNHGPNSDKLRSFIENVIEAEQDEMQIQVSSEDSVNIQSGGDITIQFDSADLEAEQAG